MKDLEALNAQPQTQINVEAFWAIRENMLREKDQKPLDFVRETLQQADPSIWEMPEALFDPLGDEASPLRRTHILLSIVVNEPEEGYTETVAKEIFPYWLAQFQDAQDWLGII